MIINMEITMDEEKISQISKALGDASRLKILKILGAEEKCTCIILEKLDITQPTLSHHMRILCECGLVESRKEGRWHYYRLNKSSFDEFRKYIAKLSDR